MGAICILTPIVIAAWPAFSTAVVAAASSLGYQLATYREPDLERATVDRPLKVHMTIEESEVVTDRLARDQQISVTRDGVTIAFARDARGKASVCVTGTGHTEEELRALGEEMGQCVVQQYVYQRIKDEIQSRRFVVVEDMVDETRAIHLKVRHWDG